MFKKDKNIWKNKIRCETGYIVLLVLVFAGVFMALVAGLAGFVSLQHTLANKKEYGEKSLHIAEAGLEYYKWFLRNNPNDLTDGTGSQGIYTHSYEDPESGVVGSFSLMIDGNVMCGQATAIDITSTGNVSGQEDITRTVKARYMRPSVAEYAQIINSDVKVGSDVVISGRYHSNGGIRMDGTNNSLVTSSVENWTCTSSFGCSPDEQVDGVFGDGPNNNLWQYPKQEISFDVISENTSELKNYAADGGGIYFGAAGGESNKRGYHTVFKPDGSVDIYRVSNTDWDFGYSPDLGWTKDYNRIVNETLLGNYVIPTECPLLFFEDRVWLEGVVNGKFTVVASDTSQPQYDTDIILSGNVEYADSDGSDGLTAIAERSVLIPIVSPNDMVIEGIFVAEHGSFWRNYYTDAYYSYDSENYLRDTMTISGSIVSNGRVVTRWVCGDSYCSGYNIRTDMYDRMLAQDPPPFTPSATDTSVFVRWEEI